MNERPPGDQMQPADGMPNQTNGVLYNCPQSQTVPAPKLIHIYHSPSGAYTPTSTSKSPAKGTYVRTSPTTSASFGAGAHLTQLRRTQSVVTSPTPTSTPSRPP